MTHSNFDGNDLLSVIAGFTTTALGELLIFGGEALKAIALGIIGGAAAYVGKQFAEKYLKIGARKQNRQ